MTGASQRLSCCGGGKSSPIRTAQVGTYSGVVPGRVRGGLLSLALANAAGSLILSSTPVSLNPHTLSLLEALANDSLFFQPHLTPATCLARLVVRRLLHDTAQVNHRKGGDRYSGPGVKWVPMNIRTETSKTSGKPYQRQSRCSYDAENTEQGSQTVDPWRGIRSQIHPIDRFLSWIYLV
ncbi:hypothetical protein LY78DRAFT_420394 [Colletotrichum sublineola]|nr:hypothetical protein LY78DRAFT_420394 [Colletotrichum sublineola]